MSEENVEIVRRVYDGFARSLELVRDERFEEWDAMPEWELYDPNVVLEELAEIPDADEYHGVEGIKRWFRAGTETFGEVKWEPSGFTAQGPHVLVNAHGRFRGAGSGVETEIDVVHLFTLRGRRIVRIRAFLDRQKAVEAAERPE